MPILTIDGSIIDPQHYSQWIKFDTATGIYYTKTHYNNKIFVCIPHSLGQFKLVAEILSGNVSWLC